MTVVADASPLVFLGKIRQLELIFRMFGPEVLLARRVYDEVLSPTIGPAESRMLAAFMERCTVVKVQKPRNFATAMSEADSAALTLAIRRHAGLLLADDRIMRQMAEVEGIRAMGTLGILLGAMRRSLISPADMREHLDGLVRSHGFRIGIELYEAVLQEIDRAR